MIIGLLLRYIKTYQGINYVPITSKDKFCGFVGNNGIGKSSVLEALDCFFNDKQWNYNIATKRSGLAVTTPLITPLFLIEKSKISEQSQEILETLSNVIWALEESDIPNVNRPHFKVFQEQRTDLERTFNKDDYYLFPLGIDYNGSCALSIFNCNKIAISLFPDTEVGNENLTPEKLETLQPILKEIKALY